MRLKHSLAILPLLIFSFLSRPVIAENTIEQKYDVVLIGGGIMSATLATLLHELDPQLKIVIYEKVDQLAFESSSTLNNAGTGHAALCELNYTTENKMGQIDVSKAVTINQQFELSLQLWSNLSASGKIAPASSFIHSVPHISWVKGEKNVSFLRKRYQALRQLPQFADMEFTENPAVIAQWAPVIMEGRNGDWPMAATRSLSGTDVDYGQLTTSMFQNLVLRNGAEAFVSHEVRNIYRDSNNDWILDVLDMNHRVHKKVRAPFVFIGAGGGTLPLLQKSGIREAKGYGGFPVSGIFLMYKGNDLSERHFGKVYGQAEVGAPPMSVPHLDTRIIDGQKRLIFGPFAGATTRYLKHGSVFDIFGSLSWLNVGTMLKAGVRNWGLVNYLLKQESMTHQDRVRQLREFVPNAQPNEWISVDAGIRVQMVKKKKGNDNLIHLGTEVVTSQDGSLSALLGASPGASTSVAAMLEVLENSFPAQMATPEWKSKLQQLLPSYGQNLTEYPERFEQFRYKTRQELQLTAGKCEKTL